MIPNKLVPPHEVMDAESAKKVLEKYKVTKSELPKIKKSDAAIAEMEPQNGDVIKITRYHPEVGESYYYRVVIEG